MFYVVFCVKATYTYYFHLAKIIIIRCFCENDLAKHKFDHARVEGKNSNSWILVDCKDVIVNVFHKDEREYYNLEKMLAEIDQLDIEDFR